MVNTCCVNGCATRSNKEPDVTFHRIPKTDLTRGEKIRELSEKRRRAWIQQINRKTVTDITIKPWTRVCSKHFVTGKPAELYDESHPDWVPSLDMGYNCKKGDLDRYERTKQRQVQPVQAEAEPEPSADGDADGVIEMSADNEDSEEVTNKAASGDVVLQQVFLQLEKDRRLLQTEKDAVVAENNSFKSEVQALTEENMHMKEKLASVTWCEDSFRDDDNKVKYYTGLPSFVLLMALLKELSPHITTGPRTATTKFQQLLMVLMRLRLNLPIRVISDMFILSESTVSRTVLKMIDVMFDRLKHIVKWPNKDELWGSVPLDFLHSFGKKVTVIIDCFEIFMETPSSMDPKCKTFSHYKHHNTMKFLIGITPQGSVSYVSKGWGGRTSDKFLTENSDFLDHLLPGDLVLADRGFNISESVGLRCAEVKIPAFTKGKRQLSAFDVESTRKLAHLRIHVERVIGIIMQKYPILDATIPVTFLSKSEGDQFSTLDKVVTVCAALVNLCPSVVPFD
ncbi:uncharacterized protein [Littorina saxatilis]|uniref:uncharacterized protein n=1 Tax=Littorina saxatilis TaxID=31220 RepID=UPI0038B4C560